jgi:transglutaminase-like putative cysteine protease
MTTDARRAVLNQGLGGKSARWLTRTPSSGSAPEPKIAAWLRPLVYAAGSAVFAWPLARPEVVASIAAGALIGAALGRPIARSSLRLPAIFALAALGVIASAALRSWLVSLVTLAEQLGPASALQLGDAVGWGLAAIAASAGLRAVALRVRLLRVLEVAFVGVAFAERVSAHRGGAINRPFEIADWIIAGGDDPTYALLAVGAAAAVVSVLLLLSEQSILRSLLHVAVAAALLALVLSSTRMLGLPQPEAGKGALGLRPDDKDGKKPKQQGGRGSSSGQPPSNDQLEFEDNYSSEGRQAPVAVVLLHDDYSPPNDLYYFRQAAFSQYNGRRLVVATMAGVDDDLLPAFVLEPQQLAPVPNAQDTRVTLDTTVALLSEHNRPFALESPVSITPASNPDPGRFRRVYRVTSAALASRHESLLGRGVGDPTWSDEQRAHYVQAPKDDRFAKLADEIVAELPDSLKDDPIARSLMVSLWLGREGTYSLKSGHASASDPTADFLFGDRIGYCVHFAHAATFLMRSLGIPARVATGYAIEEAARQGGSAILLTGAHSHAWPEMYVTGVGWTVLDVYPERSLDPPVQPPDADLQRLLGEMARGTKPLPQSEERPFEPVLAALRGLPELLKRIVSILVPGLIVLSYLIKLWRWLAPLFAGRSAPRVAYRAALDRLSEVALRRRRGETREAFAERLAQQAPLPSFSRLTGEHVRAHFGAGALASPQELRALSSAVSRELGGRVPRLRRFGGALNPFSWLRSR